MAGGLGLVARRPFRTRRRTWRFAGPQPPQRGSAAVCGACVACPAVPWSLASALNPASVVERAPRRGLPPPRPIRHRGGSVHGAPCIQGGARGRLPVLLRHRSRQQPGGTRSGGARDVRTGAVDRLWVNGRMRFGRRGLGPLGFPFGVFGRRLFGSGCGRNASARCSRTRRLGARHLSCAAAAAARAFKWASTAARSSASATASGAGSGSAPGSAWLNPADAGIQASPAAAADGEEPPPDRAPR